jgi:hypothetical protein
MRIERLLAYASVISFVPLVACDQTSDGGASSSSHAVARPPAEQTFLTSRELSSTDAQREKSAANSVALAQMDWELRAKDCRELHRWSRFESWTGRVEALDETTRGIQVKVALNNNGHSVFYNTLQGTVPKSSPLYGVVIGLHEGETEGSPVLISGRFTLPKIKSSLSYRPGDSVAKMALALCGSLADIPVSFTDIKSVPAIVEDQ